MGKTTKVDRGKIKEIRHALTGSADDLQGSTLHSTAPGDFGGSAAGQAFGDDVARARHHVLKTAHAMGGGVGGFAHALKRAVDIADETDGQIQSDVGDIDTSVSTIDTQFADPRNVQQPTQDGSTS